MKKTIYYVDYSGNLFEPKDIKQAFYIASGLDPDEHTGMYLRFLSACFKVSIRMYISPTPEELAKRGYRVMAIKQYRVEHGCSLREAMDYINSISSISNPRIPYGTEETLAEIYKDKER